MWPNRKNCCGSPFLDNSGNSDMKHQVQTSDHNGLSVQIIVHADTRQVSFMSNYADTLYSSYKKSATISILRPRIFVIDFCISFTLPNLICCDVRRDIELSLYLRLFLWFIACCTEYLFVSEPDVSLAIILFKKLPWNIRVQYTNWNSVQTISVCCKKRSVCRCQTW